MSRTIDNDKIFATYRENTGKELERLNYTILCLQLALKESDEEIAKLKETLEDSRPDTFK